MKEHVRYLEAKKWFSFVSKRIFADVVSRGSVPRSKSRIIQAPPELLAADLMALALRQDSSSFLQP